MSGLSNLAGAPSLGGQRSGQHSSGSLTGGLLPLNNKPKSNAGGMSDLDALLSIIEEDSTSKPKSSKTKSSSSSKSKSKGGKDKDKDKSKSSKSKKSSSKAKSSSTKTSEDEVHHGPFATSMSIFRDCHLVAYFEVSSSRFIPFASFCRVCMHSDLFRCMFCCSLCCT
jgi:hypothetical protein